MLAKKTLGLRIVFPLALVCLISISARLAHSQTFQVLHAFGGPGDEGVPLSGVTLDAHGNIYGATPGTVYKLSPRGSGWIYSHLYTGGFDITAKLLIGSDGSLYGSNGAGGPYTAGQIFNLRPPASFCSSVACPWEYTAIYTFEGGDGSFPTTITFDSAGNIYGTTVEGGAGSGVVYKLTNNGGGSWTYTQITDFFGSGFANPGNGVVIDPSGNLYGTTLQYPGMVFEVTNTGQVELVHEFLDAGNTYAGVILDGAGNLYGITTQDGGVIYELSPSGNNWTLSDLQTVGWDGPPDGGNIIGTANLLMDAEGNLWGTSTWGGAYSMGLVFKLARTANGWLYTDLYDFTGGDDGCYPWDGVALDSQGNLYGTASQCGQYGAYEYGGTLWKITP